MAQNIRDGEDVGKTCIGCSTKLPKVGKTKAFPWTGCGCSNTIATDGRLLWLFQHMMLMQELRVVLNSLVPGGGPGCLVAHFHPRSVTLKQSLTSEEEISSCCQNSPANDLENFTIAKKKNFQKT